jgi:hypothetical protein
VEGERVRALPVNGLVAWVSDVARGVPVTVDGVKAHDAVVEAALETGSTPVPARFGQRFDDDEACRAALNSRGPTVETLLATMQGLVEMTLLITPSTRRMIRDLEPVIPASHTPSFDIDSDAQFIPVNGLAKITDPATGFTVIGGGKTGVDACLGRVRARPRLRTMSPIRLERPAVAVVQPLGVVLGGVAVAADGLDGPAEFIIFAAG